MVRSEEVRPLPTDPERQPGSWTGLYRAGSVAAGLIAALLLAEIAVYLLLPRSETAAEHLALLQRDWLAGLLTLDLLGAIAYLAFVPTILALHVALWRSGRAALLVATALFFMGITVFFATNTALPALALSRQYAAATSEAERIAILGAGEAMFALFNETAFLTSYLMVSAAWVLMGVVMLRGRLFRPVAAGAGILAGATGIVAVVLEHASAHLVAPAIALYFAAIVFLLLWMAMVSRRLWALARAARGEASP